MDKVIANTSQAPVSFQLPWKPDGRRKVNTPPKPIILREGEFKRVEEGVYKQIEPAVLSAMEGGYVTVTDARETTPEAGPVEA